MVKLTFDCADRILLLINAIGSDGICYAKNADALK